MPPTPFQVTLNLERVLTRVSIENGRLHVYGIVRDVARGTVLQEFHADVTDLVSQARRDAVLAMENDAQAWLNNQPFV